MSNIKEFFKNNKSLIVSIVLGICLAISLLMLGRTLYKNYDLKKINIANVTALTDSIQYYKGKNGELVAEKTLLIGDMDLLKVANAELAEKINSMKVNNPTQIIYVETVVDNSTHDTIWETPAIYDSSFVKEFDFSDKWRELAGSVTVKDTTMSLNIDKDKVFVDYTLAIKDNKVYMASDNPYVQYNEIQGLTMPKQKKRFSMGIGPTISYGYDFQHKNFAPCVGISIGIYYNLFQF